MRLSHTSSHVDSFASPLTFLPLCCSTISSTYDWDHYVKNTFRFDGLPAEDADDLRSMMKVMLKTASSEPMCVLFLSPFLFLSLTFTLFPLS